jgi:S1-C subfamily serine protease
LYHLKFEINVMAEGIVIHINVGNEKRTEYFSVGRISVGTLDDCDIKISIKNPPTQGVWFELEATEGSYRISEFDKTADLRLNGSQLRRFIAVSDGDTLTLGEADAKFTFFSLANESALITTNRVAGTSIPFIEEAAMEAASTPERDDAKMFLREFLRELASEISWRTKAITAVLVIGFLVGILYLGFSVSNELRRSRETSQSQSETIQTLEGKLDAATEQLTLINESSEQFKKMVSLAPSLRVDYGDGICLIYGVYEVVERRTNRVLRSVDSAAGQYDPYRQAPMEDSVPSPFYNGDFSPDGTGIPLEFDFLGTGFHVGEGFIVTNRHVVEPWIGDRLVESAVRRGGRPRLKRLVVYFPNNPQPLTLTVRATGSEDVAVGTIDKSRMPVNLPTLPLEIDSDAYTIGKTVVSMGYPSGPDRLLAMLDDKEASTLNARCAGGRQCIIENLALGKRISPLLTQGSVTDLDSKRIVHDAKTSEGGSGAPLFGQTGRVIGVNFGVLSDTTAVNLAIPIKFALELLEKAGWKIPEASSSAESRSTQTR